MDPSTPQICPPAVANGEPTPSGGLTGRGVKAGGGGGVVGSEGTSGPSDSTVAIGVVLGTERFVLCGVTGEVPMGVDQGEEGGSEAAPRDSLGSEMVPSPRR